MSEIRIEARKLGAALIQTGQDIQAAALRAAFSAAMRLVGYLVKKTDEMGITDLGVFKGAFQAEPTPNGAVAFNDAPHSGIVELGARPHFVSADGIDALERWCVRKLHLSVEEARFAAWAIATNIAKVGIKGRFVMRDSQDQAKLFYEIELNRELHELS